MKNNPSLNPSTVSTTRAHFSHSSRLGLFGFPTYMQRLSGHLDA